MPIPAALNTSSFPSQSAVIVSATQYAGTMRNSRRSAYGPGAGDASPLKRACANGR